MKEFFKKLKYYTMLFFKSGILRKKIPTEVVVHLAEKKTVFNANEQNIVEIKLKKYTELKKNIKSLYRKGARVIEFDSFEPLLWKDGSRNINHLLKFAKRIGYFETKVTTNAQLPVKLKSDVVWINIFGTEAFHDIIEGSGSYKTLIYNIKKSRHKNLNLKMTINNYNFSCIEEVAKLAKNTKQLKKASFYFLKPEEESGHLAISEEIKKQTIEKLIRLKEEKFPIITNFD